MNRKTKIYTIIGAIVAIICILLAINNPNPSTYAATLSQDMQEQQQSSFVKSLTNFFSPLLSSYIESNTTRENFILFSIYKTSLPDGTTISILAIFNRLIPISHLQSVTKSPNANASTTTSSTDINKSSSEALVPNITAEPPNVQTDSDNKPNLQLAGTVKVIGNTGTYNLPLYGVSATYGVSRQTVPSVVPTDKLADIQFNIPADEAGQLAIYWVNSGDDKQGILLLAPKDWKPIQAVIGANGSTGVELVSDPNAKNKQSISFGTEWNGSAVYDIGSYFPKLRDWAMQWNNNSGNFSTPNGLHSVFLNDNTIAYSYHNPAKLYETNGVAIERTDTNPLNHSTPPFFGKCEITSPDKELSNTVLNFILQKTF